MYPFSLPRFELENIKQYQKSNSYCTPFRLLLVFNKNVVFYEGYRWR